MIEINGQYNTARCFAKTLESSAEEQIRQVCDQPAFAGSRIRIMPDVHAGMGCTIGTTMTLTDKVVPGMVGVDIGCGMETVALQEREIDLKALDKLIYKEIPCGRNVRKRPHAFAEEIDLYSLRCSPYVDLYRAMHSIGSLGGGNHFIEVDRDDEGQLYLVVHSGSRHLGTEVAMYYQNQGRNALCQTDIPKDLAYVEGQTFLDYIHDMKLVQRFAALNRKAMVQILLEGMNLTPVEQFTTIHNYIDTDHMILRKGAVSAQTGEKLLIPINMRDGSLLCIGKGNEDWNCSAPHGAGRLMSRTEAFKSLSLADYRREMEGIFTSCVGRATLDEAPMAYKGMEEILQTITPTAEVQKIIRPIYNFKAAE